MKENLVFENMLLKKCPHLSTSPKSLSSLCYCLGKKLDNFLELITNECYIYLGMPTINSYITKFEKKSYIGSRKFNFLFPKTGFVT
jgi:hypothetical protein